MSARPRQPTETLLAGLRECFGERLSTAPAV